MSLPVLALKTSEDKTPAPTETPWTIEQIERGEYPEYKCFRERVGRWREGWGSCPEDGFWSDKCLVCTERMDVYTDSEGVELGAPIVVCEGGDCVHRHCYDTYRKSDIGKRNNRCPAGCGRPMFSPQQVRSVDPSRPYKPPPTVKDVLDMSKEKNNLDVAIAYVPRVEDINEFVDGRTLLHWIVMFFKGIQAISEPYRSDYTSRLTALLQSVLARDDLKVNLFDNNDDTPLGLAVKLELDAVYARLTKDSRVNRQLLTRPPPRSPPSPDTPPGPLLVVRRRQFAEENLPAVDPNELPDNDAEDD